MKDAPINLPPLPEWMLHFNGQPTRQGFEAQDYARAAILADRAARARQPAAQSEADIHSCSYYCQRPECIKRQREEQYAYRDKFFMPTEGGEGYLVRMETAGASPAEPPAATDLLARGESIWRRLDPLIEDPVGVTMASKWIAEAMQFIRESGK
jgi:hypothetical protein